MILEKLCNYAKAQNDYPPFHFKRKKIGWILNINDSNDYEFISFDEVESKDYLLADNIILRTGKAIRPRLLGDKVGYVFGNIEKDIKEMTNFERDKLNSFIELANECMHEFNENEIKNYLDLMEERENIEFPEELKNDDWVAITFKNENLLNKKNIQKYWQEKQKEIAKDRVDLVNECIVCGKVKAIADRHPEKIKIFGGHKGGSLLISANVNAFESHNLKASAIAPTCFECATYYGRAINKLLNKEENSLRIKETTYIFWSENDIELEFVSLLKEPDINKVEDFINKAEDIVDNKEKVYILALEANNTRIIIRNWLQLTLGEITKNLINFFEASKLYNPYLDENYKYYDLEYLNYVTTASYDRSDKIDSSIITSILNYILKGEAIDKKVAFKTLLSIRKEQITAPRVIILKLFLNSQLKGDIKMLNKLDKDNHIPSYLFGRLFAIIEKIERSTHNSPESPVIDNYYNIASISPKSIYSQLIRRTHKNISKLKRENYKRGLAFKLENELSEIINCLEEIPTSLTLKEQSLFVIGYYHQKNDLKYKKAKTLKGVN